MSVCGEGGNRWIMISPRRHVPDRHPVLPPNRGKKPEKIYKQHQVSCTCPLLICQWEGCLEAVFPHLRHSHRIPTLQGEEIVFLAMDIHLPDAEAWIIMQACLGQRFLLLLRKQKRHQGHSQFFATVMLMGTPSQAENFTYQLQLNRNQRRLTWEATPRSVLEHVDSIIAESDCLVLNASLAHLFSDNGNLAIIISIAISKPAGQPNMER
nr:PREDICTED: seven in absentia homolog 3 [Latimeria chalumnae]|eukprot:XP_014352065.1 PREDICTED: seven in absentia homolog 3 [Latimeria chalumnae]